jgi:structural maintenance of chromosome 4
VNPGDEGLLEYLEDIIGTNQYVERIDTCAKELEELNELRSGQVNRLKLVEKERDALGVGKREAEDFMAKERELAANKSVLYQVFIADARSEVTRIAEVTETLSLQLQQEKAKFTESNEAIETLEALYKAHAAELNVLQKDLKKATAAFAEFEKKDITHRENLKNMKQRAKKLDEKLGKDAKKLTDMAGEVEQIEKEVPELEVTKLELEAKVGDEEAKLERLVESLKDETAAAGAKLENARRELQPWEGKIADAKARVAVSTAERDLLLSQKEEAKQKLEDAKTGAETAARLAAAKSEEILEAEQTLVAEKARAVERREAEQSAREQEQAANLTVREIRGKLEQRKTANDSEKSKSVIVTSLMKAKQRGTLKGVLGRLGDLGAIDAKYDVAVSTACGALDYVVVETTADAQACVSHLRQHNLGVATFLILEKQKALEGRMRDAAANADPNVVRLMDLIKPASPEVAVAFYYGVRDTAVASDLDAASKIAYDGAKRRRVVTLTGQLIETAGTMSGGGNKPKGGRMRVGDMAPVNEDDSENSKAAIAEAETELAVTTATVTEARAAAAAAAKDAKEAENAVAKTERCLPKLKADVAAASEKAGDLRARFAELQRADSFSSEDAAQLKQLEKEVGEATCALEKLTADAAGLRNQVDTLQRAMDGVGGDLLVSQRKIVKQLGDAIARAGEAIVTKQATAASHAKATQRLTKTIEEQIGERAAISEDVLATKAAFATLEDEAMSVLETQKELQVLVDEKSSELSSVTTARDEANAIVARVKHVEVDINAKLEDAKLLAEEHGGKATHWQGELAKVTGEMERLIAEARCDDAYPTLLTPEQIKTVSADAQSEKVTALGDALASMKPDMSSIEAFSEKESEYRTRADDLRKVTEDRDNARGTYDTLRATRLDEFMSGFNVISMRLKEMYQMITLGGDAELELVDSLDPFAEGIVFSVRPPKKSWKNIANLSGGEKTLSSLALVFALHHYKPTPLYVMDEIDAALDFKNVRCVFPNHHVPPPRLPIPD